MVQIDGINAPTGIWSDMDVVRRVREGEIEIFELVVRRYNRHLYLVARGVLQNEADVEDSVQDAYIRAYENLDQFQGKSSLSAWLAKITFNEALGRLRRTGVTRESFLVDDPNRREEADFMAELASPTPSPEQNVARGDLRRLMESSIDALPEAYRLVFILRGVEGLSVAETAESLELEPATVKTRYHRARKILQKNLSNLVDLAAGEVFPFAGERCDRIFTGVLSRLKIHSERSSTSS